jgi:riboflavin transporter FmnP
LQLGVAANFVAAVCFLVVAWLIYRQWRANRRRARA